MIEEWSNKQKLYHVLKEENTYNPKISSEIYFDFLEILKKSTKYENLAENDLK